MNTKKKFDKMKILKKIIAILMLILMVLGISFTLIYNLTRMF